MARVTVPDCDAVPAQSKPLLDAVEKQLGLVPDMFRVIALRPNPLQGYVSQNAALPRRWT